MFCFYFIVFPDEDESAPNIEDYSNSNYDDYDDADTNSSATHK